MKAAVCERYGPPDVLHVCDVAEPAVKPRWMLIRVRAAAVTSSDCFVRSGVARAPLPVRLLFRAAVGFARPRQPVLGLVLAGEVAKADSRSALRPGDRVYALTGLRFGAYAEYAAVKCDGIVARVPSDLSFEEAAAIPYGGLLALHFLRKGGAQRAQSVLVYGASGAVGSAAVQLAKHFGARVSAVCGRANADLVRSLGADAVLDYTTQREPPDGAAYDVVFDAVGRRKSSQLKDACKTALTPAGRYVCVDAGLARIVPEDLRLLTGLVEKGAVRPVVDRSYRLDEVASAHEYVERGHAKGSVVVTLD